MGSKKPHRHEVIDREFPVRITIASIPETHEITRQWLARNVGTNNYATKPQSMWSQRRALHVYFRNVRDAREFLLGCPHIRLCWEPYGGATR